MKGKNDSLLKYEKEINNIVNLYPGVFHYSWFDLERKINTYKKFFKKIENIKYSLKKTIKSIKKKKQSIHAYGASTKGKVLLQYFKITNLVFL